MGVQRGVCRKYRSASRGGGSVALFYEVKRGVGIHATPTRSKWLKREGNRVWCAAGSEARRAIWRAIGPFSSASTVFGRGGACPARADGEAARRRPIDAASDLRTSTSSRRLVQKRGHRCVESFGRTLRNRLHDVHGKRTLFQSLFSGQIVELVQSCAL